MLDIDMSDDIHTFCSNHYKALVKKICNEGRIFYAFSTNFIVKKDSSVLK